jgi:hypothetical protein
MKIETETGVWHEPFSPVIWETQVPRKFIQIVNNVGDKVLSSDELSKQYDWSDNLAGKVWRETAIPVNAEEGVYLKSIMKSKVCDYIKYLRDNNKIYNIKKRDNNKPDGHGLDMSPKSVDIAGSWLVSQYAGDYNPWHNHGGDFSAVIYLKIPPKFHEELEKELKEHSPANGMIQFTFGEAMDWKTDNLKFAPTVGAMLIFPAWLKHFVYPFYCEGERRSMSFNAKMNENFRL